MTDSNHATEPRLVISRWFPASPQAVYKAWTLPEQIMRWHSPNDDYATPLAEVDLRVGGRYRIGCALPDGQLNVVGGQYREVMPGQKLVYTWTWEKPHEFADQDTLVTVEFNEKNGGTELVLTHEHIPTEPMRDTHTWGWNGALDKLAGLLTNTA
jgi:uncharacterized protein YndB with AHSA1/START domain